MMHFISIALNRSTKNTNIKTDKKQTLKSIIMNNKIKLASILTLPILSACSSMLGSDKDEPFVAKQNIPIEYQYDSNSSLALNVAKASGIEAYQDAEVDLKQEDHMANGTIYSTAFNTMMFANDTALSLSTGNSGGGLALGLLTAALNSSKRDFTPEYSYLSSWAPSDYAATPMAANQKLFEELFTAASIAAVELDFSLEFLNENTDKHNATYKIYKVKDNNGKLCQEPDYCTLKIGTPNPKLVKTPSFINHSSEYSYFFYNIANYDGKKAELSPLFYFSIQSEDEQHSDLRVAFLDEVSKSTPDWVYILNPGLVFNDYKTKGNRYHQPYFINKGEKLHFIK